MKAMILAAGRGERMLPLTKNRPKPLLDVAGTSLIGYHLQALASINVTDVVINISYLAPQMKEALGDGSQYGLNISYSFEEKPLNVGGGIKHALPLLGNEPFIIISSDIWTNFDFRRLPKAIDHLAHLVVVDNPDFHPQGDFAFDGSHLILEGTPKLTFSGIGIYHPKLFANCPDGAFSIAKALYPAADNKQVVGQYFDGQWYNVGSPVILEQLRDSVKARVLS